MKSFLIVCAVLVTPTAVMAQVSGATTECLPVPEEQGFAITGIESKVTDSLNSKPFAMASNGRSKPTMIARF